MSRDYGSHYTIYSYTSDKNCLVHKAVLNWEYWCDECQSLFYFLAQGYLAFCEGIQIKCSPHICLCGKVSKYKGPYQYYQMHCVHVFLLLCIWCFGWNGGKLFCILCFYVWSIFHPLIQSVMKWLVKLYWSEKEIEICFAIFLLLTLGEIPEVYFWKKSQVFENRFL